MSIDLLPELDRHWDVWKCARASVVGVEIHVVPRRGSRHENSVRCWCLPQRDPQRPIVMVHREAFRP